MRLRLFAEVMREKAGSVPHEGTVVEIVGMAAMKLIHLTFLLHLVLSFCSRYSCSETW